MSRTEKYGPPQSGHDRKSTNYMARLIPRALRGRYGWIVIVLVYVQLAMIIVITRRGLFELIDYNIATLVASSITLIVGAYALLRESRQRRLSENLLEDPKLLAEYLNMKNRSSAVELRRYEHENRKLLERIDDVLATDKNIDQEFRGTYRVVQMAEYADQQVTLDGTLFIGSEFKNCVLVFNGMSGTKFVDCVFINCEWRLERQAKETLEFLSDLYLGLGSEGGALVEGIFDSIRAGHLIAESSGKIGEVQSTEGYAP